MAEENPSASLAVADVRPAEAPRVGKRRPLLLKNTDEVELLSSRLKYLCRLIVRDRQPYCPANGILLLIPLAATDSEPRQRRGATTGRGLRPCSRSDV